MLSLAGLLEAWKNLLLRLIFGQGYIREELEESVHLFDVYEIEERYRKSLDKARNHLANQKKAINRSKLGHSRIVQIFKLGGVCPTCNVLLEGSNHNTEHIIPLSLGGSNDDSNRVQMCKWCNHARNSVFQGMNRGLDYPKNWVLVKKYVLWSELTIDEGIRAGVVFPSVQEKFILARWGPDFKDLPTKSEKALGRASGWVGTAPIQLKHDVLPERKQEKAKPKPESLTPISPGQTGAIQGFNTSPRTGKNSVRFPSDEALMVSVLLFIESCRGSNESWGKIELKIDDVSGQRRKALLYAIRNTTENSNSQMPDWDKIPGPEGLLYRLEQYSVSKISTELGFEYIDQEEVCQRVSDYFDRARDQLKQSQLPRRLQTDIKSGIKGFSTAGTLWPMPRDPEHLSIITKSFSKLDLTGIVYRDLVRHIKMVMGKPPPAASNIGLVRRIQMLSGRDAEDSVDVELISDNQQLIRRLHSEWIEKWISDSDEDIHIQNVNEYFCSIGSNYERS